MDGETTVENNETPDVNEPCPEEASPEFINEKTLALKLDSEQEKVQNGNVNNLGEINNDSISKEENVSVVEAKISTENVENVELDQKTENENEDAPTDKKQNADESIASESASKVQENNETVEVSGKVEEDMEVNQKEQSETKQVETEETISEETKQEQTNTEETKPEGENPEETKPEGANPEETKPEGANQEEAPTSEKEEIVHDKAEIKEKTDVQVEEKVDNVPETTDNNMVTDTIVEPISPVNGELSPEREEDFQDDEEIEERKKADERRERYSPPAPVITIQPLKNMLEDIEEGELDYEDDGEVADEMDDLPDLPEYDPSTHKKETASEDGEIVSDNETEEEEREEGEIRDEDETGQVYICVDSKSDKWKKASKAEQKQLQELEEGQIEEEESPNEPQSTSGRFIPRTLCKYYNNGLCRWGSTCRFLHPGVNDKGIPTDLQPTWNATAGNYAMLRPPGMYPNAYGKAPPPMQCINVPVMAAPMVIVDPNKAGEFIMEGVEPMKKESAWERGLRRAKEVKEAAARRRQEDADFEEKRLNMKIPEYFPNDREPENMDSAPPDSQYPTPYKSYVEHDYREKPPINDDYHFDRRGRPPPDNRHYVKPNERGYHGNKEVDRSSGRARIAELPPMHPIRREERQRQREREKRREREERGDRKRDDQPENRELQDPRRPIPEDPSRVPVPPPKNLGATEWHDPWMRTQSGPMAGQKPDGTGKSGIEAVSDSSSSDSDSDSDSDSSSSKSSGSDSDSSSSDDEKRKKTEPRPPGVDPRRRDRTRSRDQEISKERPGVGDKNEPLSYMEWKRQQSLQKSQHQQQQQVTNQYKGSSPADRRDGRYNRDMHRANKPPRPDERRPVQDPRMNSASAVNRRPESQGSHGRTEPSGKPMVAKNDDKFDSPKRKQNDSDSGSDSDSDSDSESDSDSSDSSDSDSDSGSDGDAAKTAAAKADRNIPGKQPPVKTAPPAVAPAAGAKRPARKDDLLKELKAVEDAIARKRAKID